MKKLDNIVGIALVSWGMMLLFIVMWLGNKYPEIQQDLLLIVRVYIGLVTVFESVKKKCYIAITI